jgi:hypothetical protein
MLGKRVQFDDETWQSIDAVASQKGKTFQELADEAFKDLLKKHHQPVGLKAALKESVGARGKSRRGKSSREPATLVTNADELESHLAAEVTRVVLAVGFDEQPHRTIQRTEENARRRPALPDADGADGYMRVHSHGRSSCHGCVLLLPPVMEAATKFLLCSFR